MFAVAAPAEALARAFEMTRATEGYPVDRARVPGALEFMDASRQKAALRLPMIFLRGFEVKHPAAASCWGVKVTVMLVLAHDGAVPAGLHLAITPAARTAQ
jgi:hypothetical protein